MNILHIITRLIVGGAQKNTILSCAAQVRAGHDVYLAFGPIYGPEGSMLNDARASGAKLIEVAQLRRAVQPVRDWRCYHALRDLIHRIAPDVVHTHSSKAGIVGRHAAWQQRVPAVVHTIHGLPFHDHQLALLRYAYIRAERRAAKRCHKLLGITQAMCDAFAANGIGTAEQFEVVPSGIDIDAIRQSGDSRASVRQHLGIAADAKVVGIVARLDRLKGQEDLIAVLPRIAQRFDDVRLLLVGDGWYRATLEAQVRKLQVEDRVIFAGLIAPEHVPGYYRAMDVMALPSYQEGQGRTLVEALVCGCPIVGYDAGGIGAVCIDGETGRLVPCGDREKLAEAINWTLDHPSEAAAHVRSGQALCERQFSATVMCQRLEAVYRGVLEQARRSE